jgi:hypothetical protein
MTRYPASLFVFCLASTVALPAAASTPITASDIAAVEAGCWSHRETSSAAFSASKPQSSSQPDTTLTEPADAALDDYLDLHSEAMRGDLRGALMPWPALRSYTN